MREAEEAVLGAALLDEGCARRAIAGLAPEMFQSGECREVFVAMERLFGEKKPIDVVSLLGVLPGEKERLVRLAEGVPSWGRCDHYIAMVQEEWEEGRLTGALTKIAAGREGVEKKREELAALLSSSPTGSGAELTTVSFSQSVSDLAEWMGGEEKNDRVELGFRGLNDSIGGILKNGVFVLSGRSGHGKTDFALNMALQMAKRGNRVLYFSMEMSAVQVAERYVANITWLDKGRIHKKLLSPEEMVLVEDAKDWIGSGWLHTVEEARISTGKVRRYIEEYHPDVIFVDHLGLMERGTSRDPYRALGEVTNELKVIALEKKVAIVELVQMNRQIEGRQEKIPNLSDLRESGDIEQDADYVAFLVRSGEARALSGGGWMDVNLFLEKNRHGPMGTFAFHWQPQYSRYVERQ